MRLKITTALLVLALAACAGPAAPPDAFYRIEPAAPAQRFAKPILPGIVEVSRMTTDGVVDERPLAFAKGEGGPLGHYKYDLWSEPPGLMLQDRLRHFLNAAGLADRVVPPELQLLPDWIVRGKIRRLEQIAGAEMAVVELELSVVGARNGALVLLETYSARIPAGSERVEDAAAALQKGVSDIFARFLADLGRVRGAPSR
ncbi:MAG: membrane integrity-associated transporter subunit PqiC [Magnetospirillum sp.]|nr:membrane integrity-associated transporter subunit PqiC [Magnetospirillum sp.]